VLYPYSIEFAQLRWGTAIFKKFDTNSDGKLTAKELASALADLPKVSETPTPLTLNPNS
jgi:Ca2+-binding EF-hand superfamily protein